MYGASASDIDTRSSNQCTVVSGNSDLVLDYIVHHWTESKSSYEEEVYKGKQLDSNKVMIKLLLFFIYYNSIFLKFIKGKIQRINTTHVIKCGSTNTFYLLRHITNFY